MKVLQGQSLFDIAVQQLGSAEGAFALAIANGLDLTDELVPGLELQLPEVLNTDIALYFSSRNISPATFLAVQAETVGSVVDTVYIETVSVQSNLITVLQGQSLFDIAVQEFGSVEAIHALATLNGLSVTDELVPGTLLQKTIVVDKRIATYYSNKGLMPATAGTADAEVVIQGGLGYMAIGIDFIIS